MSDKLRLFIGLRVSMATLARLTEVRDALARDAESADVAVRWLAPASYHVTLGFLGWSRPEVIEAVRDRVGAALAGVRGFSIQARGLGAFPSVDAARVVWAGFEESRPLGDLAARVRDAAGSLGFEAEARPFHPHVTLGRIRKVADLSGLLVRYAEQSFSGTSVDSVILFESIMKSSGSEYVERASWSLEAGSKSRKRHTEGLDPSLTDNEED